MANKSRRRETARTPALPRIAAVIAAAVIAAAPATAMDLLVPAYGHPCCERADQWRRLIQTAQDLPAGVALHVIFNPDSGPGTGVDAGYRAAGGAGALDRLRATPALIYAYVATGYGDRPLAAIVDDIAGYARLYPGRLDGFFLDEMSSDGGDAEFYRQVGDAVGRSYPRARIIANPGLATLDHDVATLRDLADVFVAFERDETAYRAGAVRASWIDALGPDAVAHLVYDATWDPALVDLARSRGAGFLFVTDDDLPNPWDTLPGYWEALVAAAAD